MATGKICLQESFQAIPGILVGAFLLTFSPINQSEGQKFCLLSVKTFVIFIVLTKKTVISQEKDNIVQYYLPG